LDPRFKKLTARDAGAFFRNGRVFAMLWYAEDTTTGDDVSAANWTLKTKLGTKVFTHIRRFVVVRDTGHGFCWAIPVNTYRGRGVGKPGFNGSDIRAHAIIHMRGTAPLPLDGEPRMVKTPIEVEPANSECELNRASRINFGKVHTVE
jgi:hypothetical protein